MGRTTLAAMAAVLPELDTVKVRGRSQAGIDEFRAWVGEWVPQIRDIQVVYSNEEAVRDSDVVAYCATAKAGDVENYPLLKREWLRDGTFVAMPAPANIDEELEDLSVRKVVDSYGLYEAWGGGAPPPGGV